MVGKSLPQNICFSWGILATHFLSCKGWVEVLGICSHFEALISSMQWLWLTAWKFARSGDFSLVEYIVASWLKNEPNPSTFHWWKLNQSRYNKSSAETTLNKVRYVGKWVKTGPERTVDAEKIIEHGDLLLWHGMVTNSKYTKLDKGVMNSSTTRA